MLIDKHQNYVNSYINSKVKWECGDHFLFKLLPTMCEWCLQDSVFQSLSCPKHITTTYVISKFSRCKEWAERQRNKIANIAEIQLKDSMKAHNKASQETLLNLLNQIKNMNTKIDNVGEKILWYQNVLSQ